MSNILFKAMPGQVNIDEAKGIVECFVAGVGNKDSVGDVVIPGAFDASLRRRKPRVVWGHDWNQPIGKVLEIYEVANTDPRLPMKMKQAGIGGLFARVQFNLRSERGREAFASVAFFGEDQEWSIGYKTLDAVYDNERKANMLREVELYEVSPVLHGANQLTGTISIKSEKQDDRVDSFRKSKWPMFDRAFAQRIREDYPEIWAKGGNIKGNDQYEILTKIANQGGSATTDDQIKALELREAWVARHEGDFRLAGVVAQMKWLAVGSRGEDHMKKIVNDAIKKMKMRGKALDWDDELDDWEGEEKGFGKPNKEKLQALMDAVLKAAEELDDDEMLNEEDFSDTEEKDKFWKLRRLLGMSPGSSMGETPMARPVWDEDEDEDEDDEYEMTSMGGRRGCQCGCGSKNSCVVEDAEYALKFVDDLSIDVKAGRVLSTSNMQKLQNAIELLREVLAAGGRQDIEMKEKHALFIDADAEELFGLKELIDPILDFYHLDARVYENGILVKTDAGFVEKALNTALTNYFSGGIEYKGFGRRIARAARRVTPGGGRRRGGRRQGINDRFDPRAVDADGDGTVQEGTRFARPASPDTGDVRRLRVPTGDRELDKINRDIEKLRGRRNNQSSRGNVNAPMETPKPGVMSGTAEDIFYEHYNPYLYGNTPAEAIQDAIDAFNDDKRKIPYEVNGREVSRPEFERYVRQMREAFGVPDKNSSMMNDDGTIALDKTPKMSDEAKKLLDKYLPSGSKGKPRDAILKLIEDYVRAEDTVDGIPLINGEVIEPEKFMKYVREMQYAYGVRENLISETDFMDVYEWDLNADFQGEFRRYIDDIKKNVNFNRYNNPN